jgi:hypothetical protein
MAEGRIGRTERTAKSSLSTLQLWDRAYRACERAEELLAIRAIHVQRSRDLIARSEKLLNAMTPPVTARSR